MIDVYSAKDGNSTRGILKFKGGQYPCALGPAGIQATKTEGDGVTPAGVFLLRRVFYRPDREAEPKTGLSVRTLSPTDGWCDDPTHKHYNKLIALPFSPSHEELWRADSVYDLIVEIGYNDDPPVPGKGSAIFMHVAKPDYSPTQGCVALSNPDLQKILQECDPHTRIRTHL